MLRINVALPFVFAGEDGAAAGKVEDAFEQTEVFLLFGRRVKPDLGRIVWSWGTRAHGSGTGPPQIAPCGVGLSPVGRGSGD